ncbi:MAG: segregation/condensation protein A [Opitutaceae bacterium]|nr:segregation/condensation protein A [Opitutaceae bacterium]
MVPDADLRIKLPVFEGPLDLLLFLIRKNELDIYDIPIATVTKQYIEVLRSMRELDLEIAGEFFVMAASLMEIKSRMLLPRGQAATGDAENDDPLDPRWELVHQLLQYKKFKEAAAKIGELASFQRDMLTRHVVEVAATDQDRPLKPVDRIEVWNVFNLVLRRLAEKLVVGEIKGEEVTVSDKMEELLELIRSKQRFLFTDLFEGRPVTVRVLVATFIAVLELTRLKKLRVRQDEAYTDIHIEAVDETLQEMIVEPSADLTEPDPATDESASHLAPPAPPPFADETDDETGEESETLSSSDDAMAVIPAVPTPAEAAPSPVITTSAPEPQLVENPLETPDERRTV